MDFHKLLEKADAKNAVGFFTGYNRSDDD